MPIHEETTARLVDCAHCKDPHPAPREVCEHGLLLMGCDGCWFEAHPTDPMGRRQ